MCHCERPTGAKQSLIVDKEDLKNYATKQEFRELKNDMLDGFDKVIKKLDIIEHAFVPNQAAHD
ncbi:hypothetical protein HY798_04340 [Candidatus Falkowbacteria bacterium]|nr:hypothetical protein [Candidatus Falkowbacteria bacterium]